MVELMLTLIGIYQPMSMQNMSNQVKQITDIWNQYTTEEKNKNFGVMI